MIKCNKILYEIINLFINLKKDVPKAEIIKNIKKTAKLEISSYEFDKLISILNDKGILFSQKKDFVDSINTIQSIYEKKKDVEHQLRFKYISLHLTHQCNFNCYYCYAKSNMLMKKELTTQQWKKIITKIINITDKFIFTGGEPLLRNDLLDVLSFLKCYKPDAKIILMTNGSLFNENNIEIFDALVDVINVSIDSLDKLIQSNNRSSFGFDNILSLLQYFALHNPKKIFVSCVVTKHNIAQVNQLKKTLANKFHIENFNFTFQMPNSKKDIDDNLLLTVEQVKREGLLNTYKDKNFTPKKRICGFGLNTIAIDSSGNVFPCHLFIKPTMSYKICNILNKDWEQAYRNSKIINEIKDFNIFKVDKCKKCNYKYLCDGICPGNSWEVFGDIYKCVDYVCEFNQIMAKQRLLEVETESIKLMT
jgi:radical SAM protein with 4Fe4S-binding SPASM domain